MAKRYEGERVLRLTMFLVLLTVPSRVGAMTAVLMNHMNQDVGIQCYSKHPKRDLGSRVVSPGRSYFFEIGEGRDFSGLQFACAFAAAGKPRTVLDVFVGTGALNNAPCECEGDFCAWSIANEGFSCNFNQFSHRWGN